jgi:YidC/Oxa1 family membrane protein insertase
LAEFRNPNQQGASGPGAPGSSNSLLIYFGLFILVFLGMQYFHQKNAKPEPTQHASPAAGTSPGAANSAALAANTTAATADTATASTSGSAPGTPAVQAASVMPLTVENSLYKITFSNRGGEVTSWILKKYKNEEGKPLDLVNQPAAAKFGYPLSIFAYQKALTQQLSQALFVPSTTAATLAAPGSLTYSYQANGLKVTKTFTFNNSYLINADVSISQNGAPVLASLQWPAGFGDQQTLPQYAGSTFVQSQGTKSDETEFKKVSGGDTLTGNFNWAGVSDLYFAAIFLPNDPGNTSFVSLHNGLDIPRNIKKPNDHETTSAPILGAVATSSTGTLSTRIFVGPKDPQVLSKIVGSHGGPNLDKIVTFGFTTIIAKPLFYILLYLHTHIVRNWGWSILILTLLLGMVTLPSRIYMMRASMKMQRIQPQMDAIKQRYAQYKATDPKRQEMNAEVFKLQKDNGVNMFGSCLPMLIQWPLLFAFYRMLSNVIELRQAHFLWIPDLSAPDPLHLLPVFFVISMFLVQWLTPSPGVDPQQQRMMAITMPAVFGFMTWSIGAGLALYWAASNLLGVGIQLGMNKTAMGREMREMALRRAAKKKGKTINAKVVSARR